MRFCGLGIIVLVSFLVAWVVGIVAAVVIACIPGEIPEIPSHVGEALVRTFVEDPSGNVPIWLGAAFIALTQGMFLLPTFSPLGRGGRARSLRWVIIGASGIAALLSAMWVVALVATILLWWPPRLQEHGWPPDAVFLLALLVFASQLAASWFLWYRWLRGRALREDVPEAWLVRRVLACTGVVIVCTVPLDVMVRRRTNCYCAEGTIWAFVAGIGGAFWCCGPLVFLAKTRRMRRALRGQMCAQCGHLRGSPSELVCPECGRAHLGAHPRVGAADDQSG